MSIRTWVLCSSVPLDEYTAQDLLAWFRQTLYRDPDDYVFAANSSRAGKKRGKQPLWLSTIMRYYIQPVVKRLGIKKRTGVGANEGHMVPWIDNICLF